jgi:tetratricopeptide (TPR) repeat protein
MAGEAAKLVKKNLQPTLENPLAALVEPAPLQPSPSPPPPPPPQQHHQPPLPPRPRVGPVVVAGAAQPSPQAPAEPLQSHARMASAPPEAFASAPMPFFAPPQATPPPRRQSSAANLAASASPPAYPPYPGMVAAAGVPTGVGVAVGVSPAGSVPVPALAPLGLSAHISAPPLADRDYVARLTAELFRGKLPPERAAQFRVETLSADEVGLEILAQTGCWTRVVDLAERLARQAGADAARLARIRTVQLAALMRLRQLDRAQTLMVELLPLVQGRDTSVPFNLRLLRCQLVFMTGRASDAVALLEELQAFCVEAYGADSNQHLQTVLRLVAVHAAQRHHRVAAELLLHAQLSAPQDLSLPCALGRLYLHMGDLKSAERCFGRVERRFAALAADARTSCGMQAWELTLNQALLLMARGVFDQAAAALEPLVRQRVGDAVVVGNYAVAAMYSNRVVEATRTLEQLVAADPVSNLTDAVVANLAALYDLGAVRPALKKEALLQLVDRFAADDVERSFLRPPPPGGAGAGAVVGAATYM